MAVGDFFMTHEEYSKLLEIYHTLISGRVQTAVDQFEEMLGIETVQDTDPPQPTRPRPGGRAA
jgi:hypothetical protein